LAFLVDPAECNLLGSAPPRNPVHRSGGQSPIDAEARQTDTRWRKRIITRALNETRMISITRDEAGRDASRDAASTIDRPLFTYSRSEQDRRTDSVLRPKHSPMEGYEGDKKTVRRLCNDVLYSDRCESPRSPPNAERLTWPPAQRAICNTRARRYGARCDFIIDNVKRPISANPLPGFKAGCYARAAPLPSGCGSFPFLESGCRRGRRGEGRNSRARDMQSLPLISLSLAPRPSLPPSPLSLSSPPSPRPTAPPPRAGRRCGIPQRRRA